MAEAIKQIRIKTSAVNRLKKQYQSYVDEIKSKKEKISALPSITEDDLAKIRRQNSFLDQSESVLYNVKQKFIEAYEDLDLYVKEKSSMNQVQISNEKSKALEVLQQVETFLQDIQ